MKLGLVLEGGGMRGLFTAGILDVMLEEGIRADGIIGVSAGALFGCNYKSHQPGRALRYNIDYKDDPRYMGIGSLLRTGNYVNAEFAYHTMPTLLDPFDGAAFEADPAEFHLVCTDIDTGQPVYHQVTHIDHQALEWFRATGSMPLVSRPVRLSGLNLLDGGMTDCIPLRHFQRIGYERNIVVLTRPLGYEKTPSPTLLRPLFRLCHPHHPLVADLMQRRHQMYNAQLRYVAQQEDLGTTLVIRPPHPLRIGRTERNADKMRAIYEDGRHTALAHLTQLRQFTAQ